MPTPPEAKALKHEAKGADRHNPPAVDANPHLWARALTTGRVADLFLTLAGLPGHWEQIQGQVRSGNRHFFAITDYGDGYSNGGKTSSEGLTLIRFIAEAIIKAAENAKFDFGIQQMQFTRDSGWLKLERRNGRVIVSSRP